MTNTLHQQVHQFIINIDETHSTIALIKQKINWTYCECKPMQKREKKKKANGENPERFSIEDQFLFGTVSFVFHQDNM